MQRIKISEDIKPLSEFRSKVSHYVEKVNKTGRPVIITQNGRSAAVLIDVESYELMLDRIELLQDIMLAESAAGKGKPVPHSLIKKKFSKR